MRRLLFSLLLLSVTVPLRAGEPARPAGKTSSPTPVVAGVDFENFAGMVLVWLKPGTFLMGSSTNETGRGPNEGPPTRVTLTQGLWLGRTEVTQAQWRTVMGTNPSFFRGDARPVETVAWAEAIEFCRRLTAREQVAGRLPAGLAYTLPTEAQWEYACRAGSTAAYAGNVEERAWHAFNSGYDAPAVATKRPNAWGLHDMHGSVLEWCLDGFAPALPGGEVHDPFVPPTDANDRVNRGGSWASTRERCRSAFRLQSPAGDRNGILGFRVALGAEADGVQSEWGSPSVESDGVVLRLGTAFACGLIRAWAIGPSGAVHFARPLTNPRV